MASVLFLGVSAVVWLPYGLFCLANPGFLADAAGVTATSTTGTIELRAMYGGLQAGIGALALAAVWREGLRAPALVCLAFLTGGLAIARLSGVVIDAELSSYTAFGLGFEITSAACASYLLRRRQTARA
jgi:hypothetical protein